MLGGKDAVANIDVRDLKTTKKFLKMLWLLADWLWGLEIIRR